MSATDTGEHADRGSAGHATLTDTPDRTHADAPAWAAPRRREAAARAPAAAAAARARASSRSSAASASSRCASAAARAAPSAHTLASPTRSTASARAAATSPSTRPHAALTARLLLRWASSARQKLALHTAFARMCRAEDASRGFSLPHLLQVSSRCSG